ncbi:unnamed protein product [Acanthosepion pharaonis]|uniref:Uncharacterized protein n=1 Tax=Acanthosepion pharaonis TaxID=158019 RepID=A0A812DUS4_ACAPH|nr:unnamed protein product [Sepia pharaonis]
MTVYNKATINIYLHPPVSVHLSRFRFPNPTHCNRDVHFLPLFGFLLSFLLLLYTIQLITEVYTFFSGFLFLSLHNSTCNRGIYFLPLWISVFFSLHNSTCNRDICFLLWFPFFFKRRLNPQRITFSASSICTHLQTLQFGILEQEYFLYFLSGVAWVELDKFHHIQMRLMFPFINYQRFGFRSCLFQVKIVTDSRFHISSSLTPQRYNFLLLPSRLSFPDDKIDYFYTIRSIHSYISSIHLVRASHLPAFFFLSRFFCLQLQQLKSPLPFV